MLLLLHFTSLTCLHRRHQLHRIVVCAAVRLMGRLLVLGDEPRPAGPGSRASALGYGQYGQPARHPVSQSSAFIGPPSAPQSGTSPDARTGSSLPNRETRFRLFCNEVGKNCQISDNWGGPSRQQIEQAEAPSLEQRLPPDIALVLSQRWRQRVQPMKRAAHFL